jgi:tetratricopeptide (TPR) repeat protein
MIADVASQLNGRGAIALLGLEETPGIVPAVGEESRRPPALAILNHAREAIRNHCPHPLVVWCAPVTYRALREQAPDFFDYFTGLFSFEEPKTVQENGRREITVHVTDVLRFSDEAKASVLVRGSPAALALYEEQVAKYREPTLERARALLGLAQTLWAHPDRNVSTRLNRAEQAAIEALGILSKDNAPADWARGHLILGDIYCDQVQGNLAENLEKAIACYDAALEVYTAAKFPLDWAKTENSLGIAYASLPTGDRAENLRRAIVCFEGASRVYTETEFPRDWATMQNHLGNVHLMLPTGDQDENFRLAIAYFKAALRVFTETEFPGNWAVTQNNLGVAYHHLPTGDRDENVRRAIASSTAAANPRRFW